MDRVKNIVCVARREILQIAGDFNLISVLLLAPLFYSFFYGTIYINKAETDVPVVIVDLDKSSSSQKFARMLNAHQYIAVAEALHSLEEAKDALVGQVAQAVILIPTGFEKDLKRGLGADLKLYLNTTRFLVSNDINRAVNETAAGFNYRLRIKFFELKGFGKEQAINMIEPARLDLRALFSYTETYGDFLIPAVLILIIHQTLLIGLSESFAKEREENTLRQLFETASGKNSGVIAGKALPYIFLYFSYAIFFYTINFKVFGLENKGELALLLFSSLLMTISVALLSLFVSTFFKNKLSVLQILTLTSYPAFIISGYSWPQSAIPLPLQFAAQLIPLTPFFKSYIKISVMEGGFVNIYPQLIHLIILAVVYYLAAYYRINKIKSKTEPKGA